MTGLKISGCQRARLHTYLCTKVRQAIQKQDTVMHKALSVEQRIRSSYFVANNWQSRQTIKLSDIILDSSMPHCNSGMLHYSRGATTKVHKDSYWEFTQGSDSWLEHKSGFLQCAGAVDRTYILLCHPMTSQLTTSTAEPCNKEWLTIHTKKIPICCTNSSAATAEGCHFSWTRKHHSYWVSVIYAKA